MDFLPIQITEIGKIFDYDASKKNKGAQAPYYQQNDWVYGWISSARGWNSGSQQGSGSVKINLWDLS